MKKVIRFWVFLTAIGVGMALHAQDTTLFGKQKFNLHFQTTYIYQYKPAFHSPYEGPNSLKGEKEEQNSLTATLFLGIRLWKNAEFYFNPEIAGGSGLSGALGMAGSSNGETFRVGNPTPTLYLARAVLKQTIPLTKEVDTVQDTYNQLPVLDPKRYIRFYLGKYSLGDLFDNNNFSNSPRDQFINWALMNNGAWDYAANVRGYTYSATAMVVLNKMQYKIGVASLPYVANGAKLNINFKDSFALAINAEADRKFQIGKRAGNVRLLVYYNNANMGSYRQALDPTPNKPDVISTRAYGRTKWGWGINADQQIGDHAGVFGRIGWNDGLNETWCFTEIDRTASLGFSINGNTWKRDNDAAGVAVVVNGLSPIHKEYLAAGGIGFMLGDGLLNYAPESIAEAYYKINLKKLPIWFTGDYQFVLNPGYNKDRGPVSIFSFRTHIAF